MGDAMRTLLQEVGTQHGVIHAEAMRSTASGMVLCSAFYSPDEKVKTFHEESASFCFPLKVGMPGRVWHSGKVEWHADVTQLSTHQYLRKPLAIRAGFRGAVGIPFTWDISPRTAAPQPKAPGKEFTRRLSCEMAESLHLVSHKEAHVSPEEAECWSVVLIFYSTAVFSESDVDALLSSVDQASARLQEHRAENSDTSTDVSDTELVPEHPATNANTTATDTATATAAAVPAAAVPVDGGQPLHCAPLEPAVKTRLRLGVTVHSDSCPNLEAMVASPVTPRVRRRSQLWQEGKQQFKMSTYIGGEGGGEDGEAVLFSGASRCLAELEESIRDVPAEALEEEWGERRTHSISRCASERDVEEAGKVLRAVCEECGLSYGEALSASKADKSTMVLSSGRYCAGPAQEAFYDASLSITFPDGVGIPGRVYKRRRMEWHADCTALPADSFLRKELAVAAGLRGCVALPFTLNRVLFVLIFFSPKPVENKHVLTILGLASDILQRLRVARHPQRLMQGEAKPGSRLDAGKGEACMKLSSPGGSSLLAVPPRRSSSSRASSPSSSPLCSPRPGRPDEGSIPSSPGSRHGSRRSSVTSDGGSGKAAAPRLGSLLLLATAHSNSMRVMRAGTGARSLSLQAADPHECPRYLCDDDQEPRRAFLSIMKSNSFRGSFRGDGWSDCADADADEHVADDLSAASTSFTGTEHLLSSSCPVGEAGMFAGFARRFNGFLAATQEESGLSRNSSSAGMSRTPSAVPVSAGTA